MTPRLRAFAADWALANLLKRRCTRTEARVIRRRSDGALFIAGCPQDFGYAMRGLFTPGWPRASFHFYRLREFKGLMVASRKVFWLPRHAGDFDLAVPLPVFVLPPFGEALECAKIDQVTA